MPKEKCRTCYFWDNEHPRLKFAPKVPGIDNPGFCRKHRPAAYALQNFHIGIQPIMDADESCAEHRPGGP